MSPSPARSLTFWFEFASTYSYLSAMRIEALAAAAGVTVVWKPFLLGPIFQAQGWTSSPFNLYPAKGRYMVRDIERIAAARGLPAFKLPDPFPQHSLKATRLALVGLAEGWGPAFIRAVFAAEFANGANIADADTLDRILRSLMIDPAVAHVSSNSAQIKEALRRNTEMAQATGVFGAPSFTTEDDELFWGDDRLDAAISWAGKL